MSTTTTESEAYLEAVRTELDDLPEDERTDLLEDLAQHLADVTANRGDDAPPLTTLLGPPQQYAAELRAAAELPPRREVPPTKESFLQRLGRSVPARIGQKLWRRPEAKAVREFLPLLRPAWWVLRGYLVILLLSSLSTPDYDDDFPIPNTAGSHLIGLALVLASIYLSVKLGRASLGTWRRRGVIAGNLLLLIFALSLVGELEERTSPGIAFVQNAGSQLMSPHGPVTNIFPYSADGAPLDNVLLFDQDGRPLRVAMQKWWADGCPRIPVDARAADGGGVDFAYPKQYEVINSKPIIGCSGAVARPSVPLPALPGKPEAPDAPAVPESAVPPMAPLAPVPPAGSAESKPAPAEPGNAEASATPAQPGNAEASAAPAQPSGEATAAPPG